MAEDGLPPTFAPLNTPRAKKRAADAGLRALPWRVHPKLHAVCDALGNPLRFMVTGGERHDCTQAQALLEEFQANAVLADTGYDADALITWIQETVALAVIPPRSNRTVLRHYDTALYKERDLVERMFGYLKHFRRVATRCNKTALSFLSFV